MGTLINVAAILIGSALGMVFNTKLPEKALATVMQGVGLFVVFIGLQMTLSADFSSVSGYFLADGVLVILVWYVEDRRQPAGNRCWLSRAGDRAEIC